MNMLKNITLLITLLLLIPVILRSLDTLDKELKYNEREELLGSLQKSYGGKLESIPSFAVMYIRQETMAVIEYKIHGDTAKSIIRGDIVVDESGLSIRTSFGERYTITKTENQDSTKTGELRISTDSLSFLFTPTYRNH